jgi:SET domain-containing protein 6
VSIVAVQDIAEDEELFAIPRRAILTAENSSLPPDLLTSLEDPWLQLILAMVFEDAQESQSRWKAYLDILPKAFDTLMFWSPAELALLEGSAVVQKISREAADSTFSERLLPIIRANQDVFRAQGRSDEDLLALCHRMGSTIMAYAFDLEKSTEDAPPAQDEEWEVDEEENPAKGMVPLADLLNADADRNNAKLFYQEDQVVMKTIKPVHQGEELFNDYGALPSADLVRRYGYVTPNYTRYDVVEISNELIRNAVATNTSLTTAERDERWSYLDEQGILDDAYDIGHPPLPSSEDDSEDDQQPQYPDELLVILNTMIVSKEDFVTFKRKDKLPKPRLEPQTHSLLHAIFSHRLEMYPTDSSMANGPFAEESRNPQRVQMAMQLIEGEKNVLREAIKGLTETQAAPTKRPADGEGAEQDRRTRVRRE